MVSIRILEAVAGNDFSWSPGDVVDLPDEEAAKWADGYRAELVDSPPPKEPAPVKEVAEPVEEAADDVAPKAAEKAAVRSRGGGRGTRTTTRGK